MFWGSLRHGLLLFAEDSFSRVLLVISWSWACVSEDVAALQKLWQWPKPMFSNPRLFFGVLSSPVRSSQCQFSFSKELAISVLLNARCSESHSLNLFLLKQDYSSFLTFKFEHRLLIIFMQWSTSKEESHSSDKVYEEIVSYRGCWQVLKQTALKHNLIFQSDIHPT